MRLSRIHRKETLQATLLKIISLITASLLVTMKANNLEDNILQRCLSPKSTYLLYFCGLLETRRREPPANLSARMPSPINLDVKA